MSGPDGLVQHEQLGYHERIGDPTMTELQNNTRYGNSAWIAPAVLAAEIGYANQTVLNWCRLGRIPAWRSPGGSWRIPRDRALAIIAEARAVTGS